MKNMPSTMKEMPNRVPPPIPGKKMQKGRQLASVNGLDFISSSVVPISPVAFHRLLQDSLRVHDQIGIRPASLAVDGQDQGSATGIAQLMPPDGDKGLLPLVGTKNRMGKGRLISAPGVKGETGNKVSVEESLNASPNVAVSSQNIPMGENKGEHAPRLPQETTENHVRLQSQGDVREQIQNSSGKTHDHHRAGLRHTGEYLAVRAEKGGPGKDAATKTPPLSDASAVAAATATPLSLGSENESSVLSLGRLQSVSGNVHDRIQPSDHSPLLSMRGEGSGKLAPAASGVKTSPLSDASAVAAATATPLSLGSENESSVLSLGRLQSVSGNVHDRIRSALRHTSEYAAVPGEKGGSIGNATIISTDGNVKMRLPDDAGDVTGSFHSVDTRYDGKKTRPANESPLLSTHGESSGKRAQAAPREKTSPLSSALAVPAVDAALISVGSDDEKGILSAGLLYNVSEKIQNPVRSGHRNTGEYSAVPGEKGGPGKNAAIVDMEGNAKAVHADDVDAVTSGVHGTEMRHNDENKGGPDGSPLLSSLKENLDVHLRRAVVGEKASLLSTASAVSAVDAAPMPVVGSDNGEGMLSPGRQALLMSEVIDTARSLVQQSGGRVRISLTPPNLGALEIEVRVKKEGVELFMVANNSDVRQTLCSHVDQLRKALVEQGLNMDRFQVVVGDRSDGQQGRDPRQEGTSGGHREAWSEKAYLPGLDGDTKNDEMGKRARSAAYPSVGAINLFI
jgi:hypothetical protein